MSADASRVDHPSTGIPTTAEAALRRVAGSHDHNCSPGLRHQAREALGMGDCDPRQDCPLCPIPTEAGAS